MRRSPYGCIGPQESLDLILSVAAFDQPVSVLFLDDGVFQLKIGQHPPVPGPKNIAPIFGVLETYGVDQPWVEAESLRERGLDIEDLVISVRPISRSEISGLVRLHDIVVGC